MALPTSTKFDVFDWNSRYASTTDATDASLSDGVDPITSYVKAVPAEVVNANDFTTLVADATNIAIAKTQVVQLSIKNPTVNTLFTFEFDIALTTSIPRDFSDTENRLFVGAMRGTGYSAGFLFSYQGMALAAYPEDPNPTMLGGSADWIFDSTGAPLDSVTVRGIVDEDNRITVYVDQTSVAYDNTTGTDWADESNLEAKFNLPAKLSSPAFGDAVIIHASAQSALKQLSDDPSVVNPVGEDVTFSLGSLRLSTAKIIPTQRPTASVAAVKQSLVKNPVTFDGSLSVDPNGGNLTYDWEISAAPQNSTAELSGATYSSTVDSSGTDLIGTDAGKNRVRFTFKKATFAGDSYQVILQTNGNSQPLSFSLSGTTLTVNLATDAVGTSTTTAQELVAGFYNKLGQGYDADAVALMDVALLSAEGTGLVPAGTYALTGGAGSADAVTTLIPDKAGTYVVTLTVSNSSKKSKPVSVTMLATLTDQLIQHRPNSQYIFNYLSDFWNLIQDKGQLPALWSAITQAVGSDTVIAWQNDYSKALKDIARRYQRRWLAYDLEIEFTPDDGVSLVFPGNVDKEFVVVQTPSEGINVSRATIVNSYVSGQPYTTGKFLFRSDITDVKIIDVVGLELIDAVNGTYRITTAPSQIPAYKLLDSNSNGLFVEDPTLPAASPKTSSYFTSVTANLNTAQPLDVLRIYLQGPTVAPTDHGVVTVNPSGLDNTVSHTFTRVVDGVSYTWEHLRPMSSPSNGTIERTPYIKFPTSYGLSTKQLGLGDYVKITVLDPYTAEEIVQYLPVLAADDTAVFVDWKSLVQSLNVAAAISATEGQKTTWTTADLSLLEMTVNSVYRHASTLPTTDLVATPKLGNTTISTDLDEGTDYDVVDEQIVFRNYIEGTVTCVAGSSVVKFATNSKLYPGVTLDLSYEETVALGINTIVISGGNSGVYSLNNKGTGNSFHLDSIMEFSGEFPAYAPRYSTNAVSPDNLWAEVSYFDNCKQIEGNFGLLVGLPKYVLEDCEITADYLSVVKSLWFAFASGPSLGNIQLATQAFFGLLYTEAEGQVILITEPTELKDGSITVEDADGRQYNYEYPYGATLAINPTTLETIEAFPVVTEEEEGLLSAAQLSQLNNSKLPAYSKLFDVVKVDDYISNPDLIEKELTGGDILKKYHTFVVDVPLTTTTSTSIFKCVSNFLDAAKPAYTDFLLLGSLPIQDYIEIEEELNLIPTLRLRDTIHSSSFAAPATDAGTFGQPKVPAADELLLWPEEKVKEQHGQIIGKVTATSGSTNLLTSGDFTEFLEGGLDVLIESDDATAVAGYITRTVNTYDATSIQLTTNYVGTTGIYNIWAGMQDVDVKERYESGYVEGVHDDYSGDGSWNQRYRTLDMVNTFDSDIDVANSFLWVPVTRSLVAGQEDLEFAIGEFVDIADDTTQDLSSIWYDSPPVVVHVGAGVHPKLPFGVYNPQFTHPDTYIILGFDHADYSVKQFGHEDRLDAIAEAQGRLVGPVRLLGRTSGALANPTVYIDRTNAAHAKYFLTESIYQADKLTEWNPKSDPGIIVTKYLDIGGETVDNIQDNAGPFDTDAGTNADYYLLAERYSKEVQQFPYDPATPDDEQFIPSLTPGMYMDWDLSGEPGPPTKATYNWRWGFNDVGPLTGTPTAITAFTPDPNTTAVENTHVGMKLKARKTWHYTHGFTEFTIPAPHPKLVTALPAGSPNDVRIEGYYFVQDDPTRVAVPDALASSFDGTNGGGWIFMREVATGTETAVVTWSFESGLNVGKTVLGADGAVQTSTGHVLEFILPTLTATGLYDIIVRNYRPYKMHVAGSTLYTVDEGVAAGAYYHNPGGAWDGVGFGTGSWGG